jgi:hypothetical protein
MSDSVKTLENLSCSQTTNDMWRELGMDINPDSVLVNMRGDNSTVTLRFLGPFVSTRRIYASVLKQKKMNIESVINRDPAAMEKIDTYIAEYEAEKKMLKSRNLIPSSRQTVPSRQTVRVIPPSWETINANEAALDYGRTYKSIEMHLKNLKEIKEKITWQKCLLVNACCKCLDGDIPYSNGYSGFGIFVITRTIAHAINHATLHHTNEAISGLFAPDITLRKSGEGLQTNYVASIAPMSRLSDRMVNEILANGLIDIPAFMEMSNNHKSSPYYYRLNNGYKMSIDLLPEIIQASKGFEEKAHFASVEKHLNDLPDNAIENRQNMKNAFGGIEIDLTV